MSENNKPDSLAKVSAALRRYEGSAASRDWPILCVSTGTPVPIGAQTAAIE
jgi:hypothetical protein